MDEVLQGTATRIETSLFWTRSSSFYSPKELRRNWEHLIKWSKRTRSGHPVLLVRLGEALHECRGEDAKLFGTAVVSQVDRGVRKLLENRGVDQIIAVVDCSQAGILQAQRLLSLIKSVPVALNKHYPGRLKEIHLVKVPPLLQWVVQAVKPFLHPRTRAKIHMCGSTASSLPEELNEVLQPRTTERHTSRSITPEVSAVSRGRGFVPEVLSNTSLSKTGMAGVEASSELLSGTLLWVLFLCVFYFIALQFIKLPEPAQRIEDDL